MKASTKRASILLLSAALIVVSLIMYATLVRSAYDSMVNLRSELASQSNLLDVQSEAITQVKSLVAQYQSVAKLEDQLALALPTEEAVSGVMAQLNAIAQSNGASIQSVGITYLPIKSAATSLTFARGIGTLQLEMKVLSSYESFKRFLQGLETNIRIMEVRSVKIDPVSSISQDLYVYTLTVDTYYQPK